MLLQSLYFSRFLPNCPPPPIVSSFDNHARWQPVTQSARSRQSCGKIEDCEQSILHLKSARPVEVVFLGFILAAYGKVFRKASLSLMKEQVSWLSNMLPYFVPFWRNEWDSDLGLETERHRMTTSLDVGGDESLASKSSSLGVKSIRREQNWCWFLTLLVRDLVKNCFDGRPLCVSFKTVLRHPGSWINPLRQESLHVMIYLEKARVIELE